MREFYCSKCGSKMDYKTKNGLCENCARKRKNAIIKGVAIGVCAAIGVAAGVIIVKRKPDAINNLLEQFNNNSLQFKTGQKQKQKTCLDVKQKTETINSSITKNPRNYLTSIDQKKIERALQSQVFNNNMIKRGMPSWEGGYSTVDELLRVWGANDIIESFPKWREHVSDLSQDQFQEVVKRAAQNAPNIQDAKIYGKDIQLSVKSKSGKTSWNAFLNFFDETGKLSADCNYWGGYSNGKAPRFFADEIRKQMKYMIETQLDN